MQHCKERNNEKNKSSIISKILNFWAKINDFGKFLNARFWRENSYFASEASKNKWENVFDLFTKWSRFGKSQLLKAPFLAHQEKTKWRENSNTLKSPKKSHSTLQAKRASVTF